ncbi:MAG: hypothetical protein Q4E53_05330, partial [Eubacteriales bacterium]|nr:hypothetical protein [Eubacteriales bacterium]
PKYIIPFKMTKEECKTALQKHLKKNFFITKDFKDSEIESFRGIYMPTWNYNIQQNGEAKFSYETIPLEDPDYTYHYRIKAKIDANFEGISHDASESFADSISETLEPYSYKDRIHFNPAYVAGFFSDIQDVESEKYEKDAMELVAEHTFQKVKLQVLNTFKEFLEDPKKGRFTEKIPTELKETDNTLIPVWFLSYRKGNRVAYATVNGETGKVVSDTPISIPKVWTLALLLAIPLFFILNMFLTLVPETLLCISCFMLSLAMLLYGTEMLNIKEHEENINFQKAIREEYKEKKSEKSEENRMVVKDTTGKERKGWKKRLRFLGLAGCGLIALPFLFFIAWIVAYIVFDLAMSALHYIGMFIVIATIIMVLLFTVGVDYSSKKEKIISIAVAIGSALIFFGKPISDAVYYVAVIANLLLILYVLSNVWKAMNILTTRPLPQFARRGGDEYEK